MEKTYNNKRLLKKLLNAVNSKEEYEYIQDEIHHINTMEEKHNGTN
jgi:hypothetical protein